MKVFNILYSFWSFLFTILDNEGGYIGKAKKAQWAHDKAIADQQAAVLREQNATQERIARETNAAMERAARDTGIASIIGAAIGANTTTKEIKERLPHERMAAGMMAIEAQQKWDTVREMTESGYSNVAIEYALQGKSYRALYSDAAYSDQMMKTEQRKNMLQNIQMFGVKSGSNPYGADITPDQWIGMHSLKDPKQMLEVDPAIAAERQQAMEKWAQEMRRTGKGVLVDLYLNPGKNANSIKGPDPLIPDSVMPLIQSIAGDAPKGGTDYSEVIKAMNRGEDTPQTREIKWAIKQGIIDEFGNVDLGSIQSMIPPELKKPIDFNPYRELSEQEKAKLLDDYNKFSAMKVDPKLVMERQLGMGVAEKVKLNPDGTVAGKVLEGYMTSPTGEQIYMTIPNGSLQDWKTKETQMLSGLGPLFPGQYALSTQDERNGKMAHSRTNQLAVANQGNAGPVMTRPDNPYGSGQTQSYTGGAQTYKPELKNSSPMIGSSPNTGTPAKPAPANSNPAASVGGAPLAAGDEE